MAESINVVNVKKFGVIIPARYGSSRLPGKPLRMVCGKSLIVHVYENALLARAHFTIVATDDSRIADAIRAVGGDVELTSSSHQNGTERLAEVIEKRRFEGDTIVVNVQGDEPLLDPEHISIVAASLAQHPQAGISTLATPIRQSHDIANPDVVKVVVDRQNHAMYFSRAAIPWLRDVYPLQPDAEIPRSYSHCVLRHIGVYGYRAETLLRLASLPTCDYEKAESLEQLRALYRGIAIHVSVVDDYLARGVDTEDDLKFVEDHMARQRR